MRASRVRMSRYATRTRCWNRCDVRYTSGITANAASASRQSVTTIITAIASSVNRSPSPATTPAVNSSLSDSTSDVTRVTSRPTGLRSKNAIDSRCTCSKSCCAQVAHHALAEQRREHRLAVRAGERDHERRGEQQRRAPRERRVPRRQRDVDHALREHRPDELQQPVGHQQRQRTGDERAVRPHVHEQPPHEPAVVRLAERDVLVARVRGERGGHARNGNGWCVIGAVTRLQTRADSKLALTTHRDVPLSPPSRFHHARPYVVRRLR